jgi:hypothetical protein
MARWLPRPLDHLQIQFSLSPSAKHITGRLGIWLCVWLNLTGWALSALHQLNAAGYAVSLFLFVVGIGWWQQREGATVFPRRTLGKFFHRFRRPLSGSFLLLVILIFLGGALHAPANFDALTYRLPRLLNWWAAGHWFWIPTLNDRMNYSGVAWEWIGLPLMIFTHSDRGLFLINALGFLLLPGLLFSIFRQLGVARRVAWTWMWLLPLAYGYVTQAASIGNDLTGAIFCLLSVDFGLRARHSGCVSDVWCALLAAALMTGVKLSNLPLALPCLVAVWPALGLVRKNLMGSLAVAILAVMTSALPIMALNQVSGAGWFGDPQNKSKMQIENPVAGLAGNGVMLAEQSLMPPVLPGAARISDWITQSLPDSLKQQYPRLGGKLIELPGEEGAGLGLGITLPLLLSLLVAGWGFKRREFIYRARSLLTPVALAAWVSALVFMAKMGSEAGPRLMLPYYPLIILPILLLPVQNRLLRLRTWRIFLVLMALSALPVVIFSMTRPLWPARCISQRLALTHPENSMLQRLATACDTYARRNDVLAPIRSALPDQAVEIGLIAGSNDSDYSLWRPFGQRRVKYLMQTPDRLLQPPDAVGWVVVNKSCWPTICPMPLADWAQAHHAKITASFNIIERVSAGGENWCLLHIEKPYRPDRR